MAIIHPDQWNGVPGSPAGLIGATGATRYVGATTAGVPTAGTFAVGDYAIAQTDGRLYVCTVAGSPGTWTSAGLDPMAAALGIQAWNGSPLLNTASGSLTSQQVQALAVPTVAGMVYTGVKLIVATGGTSTAPTGFFVGLSTHGAIGANGTMLAQSSDLHASASLTTIGYQSFAFNATYTETATGFRFVLLLQNGAFAGTNVAFSRASGGFTYGSTLPLSASAGTGVTAFQANSSSLANAYASSGTITVFHVALY